MASAKLTSKGQITIPKKLRDTLGLAAGNRVTFHLRKDGVAEMVPDNLDLLSLFGALKPRRRGVTLEQMDEAIRSQGADK